MRLRLNGDIKEFKVPLTVSGLLSELGIKSGGVAVEVNMAIVKKQEYDRYELKEGDTVEIVNFVGGG